jgi:hypothetical protein
MGPNHHVRKVSHTPKTTIIHNLIQMEMYSDQKATTISDVYIEDIRYESYSKSGHNTNRVRIIAAWLIKSEQVWHNLFTTISGL